MSNFKIPKKLIEVALPLDDINKESSREKSIRHGHPSTMHLWWARRPLAAARAIIFAQMVNDPGGQRGWTSHKTKAQADLEREELFEIIRELVKWENTDNEEVLDRARKKILESWKETCALNKGKDGFDPEILPGFHDPFAGGGAIPLEAKRLGLVTHASDLNPVAVLLNKGMLEAPHKFIDQQPFGPLSDDDKQQNLVNDWSGTKGIAEDVRRYGMWLGVQAQDKLREYYPTVNVESQGDSTVVGWIWARTVECPNPACKCEVPLLKSLQLTKKKGKETFLVPETIQNESKINFSISKDKNCEAKGNVKRKHAECFACSHHITLKSLENREGNNIFGEQLVAIVAKTKQGKVFLSANDAHESVAVNVPDVATPSCAIDHWRSCTNCVVYGFDRFEKLFTRRQLLSLTTYSDLIESLFEQVKTDSGSEEYAKYICLYLSYAVSRLADLNSSFATWINDLEAVGHVFTKQAIPMVWDFVECNPIDDKWAGQVDWVARVVEKSLNIPTEGFVYQKDAAIECEDIKNVVISTDPPYYDNIPYSNLSDFFYMWLRRSLKGLFQEVTGTLATPKDNEIVANRFRHGSKDNADSFFENRMKLALESMRIRDNDCFPVTIYYAFKQSETSKTGTSSSGWETFLSAVIDSGFSITGTWPVRTERGARSMSIGNNALASSIVLVCKKRESSDGSTSRRSFQRELREKMPEALEVMIGGETGQSPIAPVDLAQSAIGPGMAIFSKYEAVLNQDGSKMSVHDALILINRAISECLNPDSGNFDNDTLFCDDWFSQYGWGQGQFGEADTLARAKGTSVDGVRDAGVIESGGGKVRLLKWSEYPTDWDPKTDTRTPVWEACHQMIRVLNQQGEAEAGALLARMPERGEHIRQLAYHLYTLCERKKWAEEARAYNELIGSWHAIVAASHEVGHRGTQSELGLDF